MLPRVKILFLNGLLGTVGESADGLMALVCGAAAVAADAQNNIPGMALNTVYELRRLADLTALGVTEANNATLYKQVKEFYDEAEDGTKLILYPVAAATKAEDLCDYTKPVSIQGLITNMNGALRGLAIAGVNTGVATAGNKGLDPDVLSALPKAQQLAEKATSELYAPLFILIEGRNFDSSKLGSLENLTALTYNRVAVVLGDTVANSKGACMGTLLGRIASIPVQRNIGRVKSGSLFPVEMYIGASKIDESQSTIESIFDKGYIIPRKYVGRSGYYFADDPMACAPTDDYAHLTNRRVIDKAYRIAYDTMLNELLDELDVNTDGTMQYPVIKSMQQTLENAINRQMTVNGELSSDEEGNGCRCYINPNQNVVSTSKFEVTLKARPHGYPRDIDVNLGFLVQSV